MPPKAKVVAYIMPEQKEQERQVQTKSQYNGEDAEKQIRRETQQRLQRIEQQRLQKEQEEAGEKRRIAEEKKLKQQQDNQNIHGRSKSPSALKVVNPNRQEVNQFQKYLQKVQQEIGGFGAPVASMDLSYLQNDAEEVQKVEKQKENLAKPNRNASVRSALNPSSQPITNKSCEAPKQLQQISLAPQSYGKTEEGQAKEQLEGEEDYGVDDLQDIILEEVGQLPTFNENSDSDCAREELLRSQHLEKRKAPVSYEMKSPEAREILKMRGQQTKAAPKTQISAKSAAAAANSKSKAQGKAEAPKAAATSGIGKPTVQNKPPAMAKSQPPKAPQSKIQQKSGAEVNPRASTIQQSKIVESQQQVQGRRPQDSISTTINKLNQQEAALERELMGIDKKLKNELTEEDLDNVSMIQAEIPLNSPRIMSQLSVFPEDDGKAVKQKLPPRQQLKRSVQNSGIKASIASPKQQQQDEYQMELDSNGEPTIPKDIQVKLETEMRQQQSRQIISESLQQAKVNPMKVVRHLPNAQQKSQSAANQQPKISQQYFMHESQTQPKQQIQQPNAALLNDMFGSAAQQRAKTPRLESSNFVELNEEQVLYQPEIENVNQSHQIFTSQRLEQQQEENQYPDSVEHRPLQNQEHIRGQSTEPVVAKKANPYKSTIPNRMPRNQNDQGPQTSGIQEQKREIYNYEEQQDFNSTKPLVDLGFQKPKANVVVQQKQLEQMFESPQVVQYEEYNEGNEDLYGQMQGAEVEEDYDFGQ